MKWHTFVHSSDSSFQYGPYIRALSNMDHILDNVKNKNCTFVNDTILLTNTCKTTHKNK